MWNQRRGMERGGRRRRLSSGVLCSACCAGVVLAGCGEKGASPPTTRPSTVRERQEQALKDPFGYSPDAGKTDISGGGLTDFDRDGFNRDLKNVLDP